MNVGRKSHFQGQIPEKYVQAQQKTISTVLFSMSGKEILQFLGGFSNSQLLASDTRALLNGAVIIKKCFPAVD